MDLNRELIYKRAMLLGTKGLGQKIRWVIFSSNMCQEDHTFRYSFPNQIIINSVMVLIEFARGNVETCHHTLIVSQNLGWSINKNSMHSEFVSHLRGQFCVNYHGRHLWSVSWVFHSILTPDLPLDWGFVEKHEYSSNRQPSFNIICMVCINKGGDPNRLVLRIWCVM